MTRIDHTSEARRLQSGAREIVRAINGDPAFQPHMAAIIMLDDARLETTLALVEQQRIANLIALSAGGHGGSTGLERHAFAALGAMSGDAWGAEMQLRPDIAAALGLTAGQEGEKRG